jgi:hypothetical protein
MRRQMADFTSRRIVREIFEVAVPNPTVGAEFDKATVVVKRAFREEMGRDIQWDDDIQVRATDDEIILFFVNDRPKPVPQ